MGWISNFLENFNSQPHKGADPEIIKLWNLNAHFNSQPHKGADEHRMESQALHHISTHSPTRGLTIDTD